MTEIRDEIATRLADTISQALDLPVPINEPEPTRWTELKEATGDPAPGRTILRAVAVQDESAPERLSFVRGATADPTDELEVTLVIAYAVQIKPGLGDDVSKLRMERRRFRKLEVAAIVAAIEADRTLGLALDVCAEIDPPAYEDGIAFQNTLPCATALIPVRVLYTGSNAAA
ncbi:MAG: hypothetical protein DI531_15440 [Brevundimonas sp.]|uniref:hypothetical protein n=1 Tax=Brevundimonas sp. TaxID=1871086 RepID=UPI000DB1609A|nr:hypothetical protein [Brevundimonas sp.]PZU71656.1 MAG: hypothetical protein DI531_15440 [Brevundimonas sp.]